MNLAKLLLLILMRLINTVAIRFVTQRYPILPGFFTATNHRIHPSCLTTTRNQIRLYSLVQNSTNDMSDFSNLLINPDKEGIEEAAELIRSGKLVAFPTEVCVVFVNKKLS